jgi:hypothetical protein
MKKLNRALFVSTLALGLLESFFRVPSTWALEDSSLEQVHAAFGLGSSFSQKALIGEMSSTQFTPELVGYGYLPLSGDLWLRPSVRSGFSWQQPEMPYSLQMNEYDFHLSTQVGLVWGWIVTPSLSIGGGGLLRKTSLVTTSPIFVSNDSETGGTTVLPFLQGQLGVGVPINKGWMLVEPYLRYTHVFGDHRYAWGYGVEATVSAF